MQRSHDSVFTSVGFESGSSTSSYQYGNSSASAMASRCASVGLLVRVAPAGHVLSPTHRCERAAPASERPKAACVAGERNDRWHGLRAQWTARRRRRRLGRARPGLGAGVGGRRRDGGDLQPGPSARGSGGGRGGRWVHPAGGGRRRRGGWRGVRRRRDRGPRRRRHPRHQRRGATGGELRVDTGRRLPGGARPQPDVGRRHGEGRRRPDARPRAGDGSSRSRRCRCVSRWPS